MTGAQIFENIRIICGRISHAAIRAGRKPEDIKLIAVTKTISIQQIKEAIGAGLRIFGESKVQEAREKIQDSRFKIQNSKLFTVSAVGPLTIRGQHGKRSCGYFWKS